jgi:hypothetical protein
VLKIPHDEPDIYKERDIIVTTTLALVVSTTLIFGSLMNLAKRVFIGSSP